MQFEQISPDLIEHICLCKSCRDRIYEKRKFFIMQIDDTKSDENSCESIKNSDLLAYCLPRYFDTGNYWYKQLDSSVTEHISHCKGCLQKLQLLHRAIFNIADRVNSDIST